MQSFRPSASGPSGSVSPVAGSIHLGARSRWQDRGIWSVDRTTVILLAAIVAVFSTYAFVSGHRSASSLEPALSSGRGGTVSPALSLAFYGIASLIAFLVLLALLRGLIMLLRRFRKPSPSVDRPLEPLATVAINRESASAEDRSVHVERVAPLRAERPSSQRERATDGAAAPRTQELSNPSSAQRKAIHAAALHAIESRSLRMEAKSGLHRRNSDYEGPRRRATDDLSKRPHYNGPSRRVSDEMGNESGLPSEQGRA